MKGESGTHRFRTPNLTQLQRSKPSFHIIRIQKGIYLPLEICTRPYNTHLSSPSSPKC